MRAMKDSGIEWIGQIPKEWNTIRVKYVTTITNGSDPKTEGNTPVYGSGSGCFKTCGECKEGPTVLLGRKGTVDIPQYITGNYWNVDTAFDVKTAEEQLELEFYYFASTCFDYKYYTATTTLPSMTQTNYGNMYIPFPPVDVQRCVVAGIKEKLVGIDALIAAKEKTNALLKERRQSIIYEAVTKGLNPDAPMKDSGIEWIGEIPEHWEVRRLKVIAEMQTGTTPKTSDSDFFDGDVNWFTPADFSGNMLINESERKLTQKAIEEGQVHLFPANTIMIVGIGATVGKTAFTQVAASCNQQITAILIKEPERAKYYAYWLAACSETIKATANHTTLPIINNQHLGETFCPYANSVDEQDEITEYLDRTCAGIDGLISANEATIQKLKEYRQSIIYEAVTGKIEI